MLPVARGCIPLPQYCNHALRRSRSVPKIEPISRNPGVGIRIGIDIEMSTDSDLDSESDPDTDSDAHHQSGHALFMRLG